MNTTVMIAVSWPPAVASFTKEVNWRLTKRPLKTNGRLANHQLTSLVKEATGIIPWETLPPEKKHGL